MSMKMRRRLRGQAPAPTPEEPDKPLSLGASPTWEPPMSALFPSRDLASGYILVDTHGTIKLYRYYRNDDRWMEDTVAGDRYMGPRDPAYVVWRTTVNAIHDAVRQLTRDSEDELARIQFGRLVGAETLINEAMTDHWRGHARTILERLIQSASRIVNAGNTVVYLPNDPISFDDESDVALPSGLRPTQEISMADIALPPTLDQAGTELRDNVTLTTEMYAETYVNLIRQITEWQEVHTGLIRNEDTARAGMIRTEARKRLKDVRGRRIVAVRWRPSAMRRLTLAINEMQEEAENYYSRRGGHSITRIHRRRT